MPVPTFEEWIRWVFDLPAPDPAWFWEETPPRPRLLTPPLRTVVYLTRLFRQPDQWLRPYSEEQVCRGLWFLADSACSDHLGVLESPEVAAEEKIRCAEAMYGLFERLFAIHCSDILAHRIGPRCNPMNDICYMWWELVDKARPEPPADPAVDHACLAVMAKALELPSLACLESALHGLGHWRGRFPAEVDAILDDFLLHRPNLDPPLLHYAAAAREGILP
ncbi:hypothetical protein G3N55_09080 [Dissulfurirhabdus thermomarina]|uniref:Uncharacterized protein n=1 Tax=Dissulfurirhabdus thermomarina TaxID=1765737 RepID=A0A6N9TNY8_DISTH|nr:hypothetical protein [Dissulfurirhabdus thermomarina]NDY42992.1 hypothetical protein [Dissulfurirhabdus thermomarina]NMX22716.1 hypothetical protein [Dissulfurirhabdus thermomarina]